jgi:DNA modification methylase
LKQREIQKMNLARSIRTHETTPHWCPTPGHIVLWGDLCDALAFVESESVDFVCTDPPYNMTSIKRGDGQICKDMKTGQVYSYGEGNIFTPYQDYFHELRRVMKPEASLLIWETPAAVGELVLALISAGFTIRRTVMWYCTERINYGKADRRRLRPVSDLGIWATKGDGKFDWYTNPEIETPPPDIIKHSTPRITQGVQNGIAGVKPLKLIQPFVEWFTPPAGVVLDCFLGSGTTMAAAENCGRACIGIELVEDRKEIISRRIKQGQSRLFDF